MHYIQSYILDKLVYSSVLRNRDMRPPNVESNLYQYHLLQLQKEGYVTKAENGYTLTGRGLAYADRHSTSLRKARTQPKLITVIFVTDESGKLLLVPKKRQPFMDTLHLPSGKIHLDESIQGAAARELSEKVHSSKTFDAPEHFGVAHITIKQDEFIISDYIALLMHSQVTDLAPPVGADFYEIKNTNNLNVYPGVNVLIDAFTNKKPFSEATIKV